MSSGAESEKVLASHASVRKFQKALIDWFDENGRDYPWRRTDDPYAILVSELMLQQTRVATVLERRYFERWMKRFPNVEVLALADEAKVLKNWEGLGYYNRARNLQKAAKLICEEFDGSFPQKLSEILALPGVGRYTAGAVFSFAFDRRGVIVDGNVARVLSRIFAIEEPIDSSSGIEKIWKLADRLTPESDVRKYNSAIMEIGQRVCSRTQPCCLLCPISDWCSAYRRGITETIPVKKSKQKTIKKIERVAIIVRGGKIFLTKESGSRRKGMWRLPEIAEPEAADLGEEFRFDYFITKYRVTLIVYAPNAAQGKSVTESTEGEWFSLDSWTDLPAMGSPYQKAILKFREGREPTEEISE